MDKAKKVDPQEAVQKAFGGIGKDNDKIRFSIEGGKALRIRLDIKTAVIKFASLMDHEFVQRFALTFLAQGIAQGE